MKVCQKVVLLIFLATSNLLGAARPVPILTDNPDSDSGYESSVPDFSEEGSSGYESSGNETPPQVDPGVPTLSGDTSGTGHQVASVDGQDHQMSPNEREILYEVLGKMQPDPQDPDLLARVGATPDPRKLVVRCTYLPPDLVPRLLLCYGLPEETDGEPGCEFSNWRNDLTQR